MSVTTRFPFFCVCVVFAQSCLATPANAFPPYKSTDADTADAHTLELRVGLVETERADGENEYVSPLLRANIGLPNKFEITSEFDFLPDEGEFAEGAVGVKWAPVQGPISFAVETLALLPIRPDDTGIGVESLLIATWRGEETGLEVHANAGGFYDPRGAASEKGWRASILTEFTDSSFRPGIELFAKRPRGESADVRLGAGIIKDLGGLELRSAVHVGLSDDAPDLVFSLWFSTKIPLR